jgi:UDP-glucose 4,6-dehydratase
VCSHTRQTHVDNSFGNSFAFTENNVLGTHTLLESARQHGKIKRFLHVSTDEVYGEVSHETGAPCGEHSTLEPTNPYSATKAAAEMLVKAYSNSYNLPCIVTRGNNVYGPHQYPEKLIPKFALLAKLGGKMPVHGKGGALRSYLYVSDVAEAFDLIGVARDICSHFGLDVADMVETVADRPFNDRR